MNTIIAALPNRQTQEPSREGLAYHEILADGIIHAAAVFGIEQDEFFVERVATISWSTGVKTVETYVQRAAILAEHISEGLETGRSETQKLCRTLEAAVDGKEAVYAAIRDHYAASMGTRELEAGNPEHAEAIRQLVGEAVLAGLSCRGLAPNLYRAVLAINDQTKLEQRFLCDLLSEWVQTDGLPWCHPFLQMAERFYRNKPYEKKLVCDLMCQALSKALGADRPWALDHWLAQGWKTGFAQGSFAPDTVEQLLEESGEKQVKYCRELYRDCVLATAQGAGCPDLEAAFTKYLESSKDCGLHIPTIRESNPRLLAAKAFDFTVWMGFLAGMPSVAGQEGGEK
jgi:hypothetical protein